jgi:NitT/TauT family transport system substrate-binding protein
VADSEWLAKNKDLAERFLRATLKGWREACSDPAAAAEIVWARIDQSVSTKEHQLAQADAIARLVAPGGDVSKVGYIDPALVSQTVDIALAYSLIAETPSVMYDTSFWEAATK